MHTEQRGSRHAAARMTLIYTLLGGAWIILTEFVITYLIDDSAHPAIVQAVLSYGFVIASAILLYTLLHRELLGHERARQALVEREATLEAVITASPDAISILEPSGRVRSVSPAIRDLAGCNPDEHIGRDALEHVHPEDRPHVRQAMMATLDGRLKEARVRFRYRHAQGDWIVLESHGRPLRDPDSRPAGVVVVSREITERARLEAALAAAKETAEAASRAKSEFLSRMSHELRTPLNAILGFAQILELNQLQAAQRESVGHILKAGRLLLDLINEVLDIARIETSRLSISLEPVHVGELIGESLDLVRHLAQPQNIDLQATMDACDHYVLADRQRLKQVLLNLLSNALKYNRVQGTVTVRCETAAADWLRIEVQDTGPGIAPEKMRRLFLPFERLGAEQTEIEGTGLGLALSRGLVEAMGGEIGAESRADQGSTFWITLPLSSAPDENLELPEPAVRLLSGHAGRMGTVLCIEDNISNIRLIEYALSQWQGFQVLTAMQGQLGLELARGQRPDLILLDLHLPDMPGERVLRVLREDSVTRDIPVLVVTADATQGQIDRLLGAGADAYLTKPLDIRLFVELVDDILKRQVV